MTANGTRLSGRRPARLAVSLSGTNLARAADYNQRVVLQAVRQRVRTTRVELAAVTGLTAPTIANITRRLESDGLIRTIGRVQQGRGQPALELSIDPDGAYAIGLNIDRDHLSFVCLDLAGNVRASVSKETNYPLPTVVHDFVATAVDGLLANGLIRRERIIGAGIAMPDQISRSGFHDLPAGYDVWNTTDPAALVADVLPWPIHVDNDAAAAALGEMQFGGGLERTSFFYLLINAGLGGGMVLDGSFYRGTNGRSGEIGFITGRAGAASGKAIETRVSLSALYDRLSEAGCASGTIEALDDKNAHARRTIAAWIEEAADLLFDPLIAVNCLIDPQVILIGGRLPPPLIDALAERLSARLASHRPALPAIAPIRRATMPEIAPAIGAALLPFSDRLLPSDAILMNLGRG